MRKCLLKMNKRLCQVYGNYDRSMRSCTRNKGHYILPRCFFSPTSLSEVTERLLTNVCDVFGSEPNLQIVVQNLRPPKVRILGGFSTTSRRKREYLRNKIGYKKKIILTTKGLLRFLQILWTLAQNRLRFCGFHFCIYSRVPECSHGHGRHRIDLMFDSESRVKVVEYFGMNSPKTRAQNLYLGWFDDKI